MYLKLLSISILVILSSALQASTDDITPEELERWFNSNSMDPPRYKDSNDGHLVFLSNKKKTGLHHHHNSLKILPDSLESGWIKLVQCHSNIDKVPAAQILFKQDRIKNIKIIEFKNMRKAWVEGSSVQMEDVEAGAHLCLSAKTHSLNKTSNSSFTLKNGPYMRKFLDSYFPMRVSIDLDFTNTGLKLVGLNPIAQAGFDVKKNNNFVRIDTVFEGKLYTEFHFTIK